MEKLIETKDLYTDFFTFEGVVKALNGVSLVVNQGETYGLVGESGCGKSVSVRSMMRIVQAPGKIVGGKILLFLSRENHKRGIDILKRSEAYMESVRGNDISMIFQEASTSLNPVLSIGYQVGESFYLHRLDEMLTETIRIINDEIETGVNIFAKLWKRFQIGLFDLELKSYLSYKKRVEEIDKRLYEIEDKEDHASVSERNHLNRKRDNLSKKSTIVELVKRIPLLKYYSRRLDKNVRMYVVKLLEDLGVPNPDNIVDRFPHELSGGMQQRIVIAIALACHPTLLIADEPTSNLDVTIQAQIIDLIKLLKKTTISSVLFITHDLGLVAEICDRVTVMYAGDACETATVSELFKKPLHPYTQGLLKAVPKLDSKGELETIPGTVPNLVNPPSGCRFHPRCPHAMDICSREKPETIQYADGHAVACHLYTEKKG